MSDIHSAHRQFRNLIRSYQLDDMLAVIRAYSQNLAFDIPFASDLQVLPAYTDPAMGIKQWELEILAREAVAHAARSIATRKSLRKSSNLAAVINQLRALEELVAASTVDKGNVLTELHRIFHRQLEWQTEMPSGSQILRHYKIFSSPQLDSIVRAQTSLTTHQLYLVGMQFFGCFLTQFALFYPPNIVLSTKNNVSMPDIDNFLAHFCKPVDELSQLLQTEIADNLNENYAYFFDSLRAYPLVKMRVNGRNAIVAPIPILMMWRFTRGLYYELYGHKDFGSAFGAAFQAYVGDILTNLFSGTSNVVLPEEPSANDRGVPSSD